MIKRTPQEIADFFQCYVVQASKYEGSSFRCSDEKPKFGPDCEYWVLKRWFEIPDELIEIPADHDWTHLYEPQPCSAVKPVLDNKGSSYSKESVFSDNTHASEVFIEKEYGLVSAANPRYLEAEVSKYLRAGWKLYGAPFKAEDRYGDVLLIQAMVR